MSLRDYHEEGATSLVLDSVSDWLGQSFTPSEDYIITDVELRGKKTVGQDIGTVTVSIKAVDENEYPTGPDLAVGTKVSADIPETHGGIEFIFVTPYTLTSGIKYAIVARASSVTGARKLYLVYDNSSEYGGGCLEWSTNSGSSYTSYPDWCVMFRTYGDVFVPVSGVITAQSSLIATSSKLVSVIGMINVQSFLIALASKLELEEELIKNIEMYGRRMNDRMLLGGGVVKVFKHHPENQQIIGEGVVFFESNRLINT